MAFWGRPPLIAAPLAGCFLRGPRRPRAPGANALLAGLAYAVRSVGGWGMAGGIRALAGAEAFAFFAVFFGLGSAATTVGWKEERMQGVAQENGARRGGAPAVANPGVAAEIFLNTALGALGCLALASVGL